MLLSRQLQVKESEVIQHRDKQALNYCSEGHTWQEKVQSSAQPTVAESFLSTCLSRIRKLSSAL